MGFKISIKKPKQPFVMKLDGMTIENPVKLGKTLEGQSTSVNSVKKRQQKENKLNRRNKKRRGGAGDERR